MASNANDVVSPRTPPPGFAPAPKPRHTPLIAVDFADENIRQLRALWNAKRPGRAAMPAWSFFDPLEMRPWDSHLIRYEMERDDQGIAYRIVACGSRAATVYGGNHVGRYLHDALSPTDLWTLAGHLDAAVKSRSPVEVHEVVPVPDSATAVKWDKLSLPLADDGKQVSQLLSLTYAEKIVAKTNGKGPVDV